MIETARASEWNVENCRRKSSARNKNFGQNKKLSNAALFSLEWQLLYLEKIKYLDIYRVLHKWQNEVTTSKTVIFQHFKHNNMTILHNILGDLLYSFLGSPILVFLEHVLEVAALHVDARSDQQVLRHPPHLGRGQAAQVRATWRAATSGTCSRNTRIGLPRNEYSKSPSI